MRYQRYDSAAVVRAVQAAVESGTGLRCYDAVPFGAHSPFYYVQLVGAKPSDTKTTYGDRVSVWVHAVAAAERNGGSGGIYRMIRALEQAMTAGCALDPPVQLVRQRADGLQSLRTDETREKHAVMGYTFEVAYQIAQA